MALANLTKKVTMTANSEIEVTADDSKKKVTIENFSASIDSSDPENVTFSSYFTSEEAKKLYRKNRTQCKADYTSFEDAVYAVADAMVNEVEED